MSKEKRKTCFVLSPIGEEESDIRKRADKVVKYVIKPIVEECGYQTIRADDISEPGMITKQIIEHILEDHLVIADLTSQNPNVFYELAVRHAIRKPTVQIIAHIEHIPFDVSPLRTIKFDIQDIESVENCKKEIKRQITTVEKDPSKVDNPITVAIDLQALSRSGRPQDEINAEILESLQYIRYEIANLPVSKERITGYPYAVQGAISPQELRLISTPQGVVWAGTPEGIAWGTTIPTSIGVSPLVASDLSSKSQESKLSPKRGKKGSRVRKKQKEE